MNAQVISLPSQAESKKVEIGAKYDGKRAGFADTRTGVYWESLPEVSGDSLKLQKGLIGWKDRIATHDRILKLCTRKNKPS